MVTFFVASLFVLTGLFIFMVPLIVIEMIVQGRRDKKRAEQERVEELQRDAVFDRSGREDEEFSRRLDEGFRTIEEASGRASRAMERKLDWISAEIDLGHAIPTYPMEDKIARVREMRARISAMATELGQSSERYSRERRRMYVQWRKDGVPTAGSSSPELEKVERQQREILARLDAMCREQERLIAELDAFCPEPLPDCDADFDDDLDLDLDAGMDDGLDLDDDLDFESE